MLILKSLNEYVSRIKIKIKFVYVNNFSKRCREKFCRHRRSVSEKRALYAMVLSSLVDDLRKKSINIYCSLCG